MNLAPLLNASLAIQLHVATVLPAFLLGTYLIFASRKGSPTHRKLGWLYLGLMVFTSITALFIHEINPNGWAGFSLIHLFVPLTLFGIYNAVMGVRTSNLKRHRGAMLGVYVGGILIAGAFTFLPGRIMHAVVFP